MEAPNQNGFPLVEKSTIFFIPFYLYSQDDEAESLLGTPGFVIDETEKSLWIKEQKMLTDEKEGNAIYPHIMSFLQGQMMQGTSSRLSHLQIYSVAKDNRLIVKRFWNKFSQSEHFIEVGDKSSSRRLSFRFINGVSNLLSPHLFIYPASGIGILSFSVSITNEDATTEDLKLLNYHLHKIFHPLTKCVCEDLSLTGKEDSDVLKAKATIFRQARSFIGKHLEPREKNNAKETTSEMIFSWNMLTLCHFMLKDIQGSTRLFSPSRAHIFTFATIDDAMNNRLKPKDILPDLYGLSRCVNNKYMLPLSGTDTAPHFLQTFENVHVASCVEGSAFIAVLKQENKEHFKKFKSIIAMRYFWIYLLALVQRYSLLNIDRILIGISFHSSSDTDSIQRYSNLLWRYLTTIQDVKVRCHFTDISSFSQHNEFYKYCCDKLHVNIAYDEIDKKTKALNLTISHDMQLLHEEEVHQQERRDHNLNLFLGILAALQAIGIIYDFAYALFFNHDYRSAVLYLGLIILAVIMMIWLYASKKH